MFCCSGPSRLAGPSAVDSGAKSAAFCLWVCMLAVGLDAASGSNPCSVPGATKAMGTLDAGVSAVAVSCGGGVLVVSCSTVAAFACWAVLKRSSTGAFSLSSSLPWVTALGDKVTCGSTCSLHSEATPLPTPAP